MRKRVTALLLTLVLLVSLLPMPAAAVSTSERAQIRAAVEKVVKDYAKKVYQADSADDAFADFFYHGFFGNGKKKVLKESDSMVAALFNAKLMQEGMVECLTAAVLMMQDMRVDEILITGGPGWHEFFDTIGYYAYFGSEKLQSKYYGTLVHGDDIYGKNGYTGSLNKNDEAMRLLVGSSESTMHLKKTGSGDGKAYYTLDMKVYDVFDFTSDYDHIKDKGFDTSVDDSLVNLGYLLTFVGLTPFAWEFEKSFQLELPVFCDHQINSYHWVYDADTMQLRYDTKDGFVLNEATQIKPNDKNCYYKLDQVVILRHDRPWVVEYNVNRSQMLSLSALASTRSGDPYLYQGGLGYTCMNRYEFADSDGTGDYVIEFSVAQIGAMHKFVNGHQYTCRLENLISEDGSNMVYVTIEDDTSGETVIEQVPMNDHWITKSGGPIRENQNEKTDQLNGMNIQIKYLGNTTTPLTTDLDLKIWENGKGANEDKGAYRAPTCTKAGGYVRICDRCGAEVISDMEAALGHAYGEYTYDDNAGCVKDGTKTAKCSRCGNKNTVTVPDTALGHSYGEYIFDNNAGCVTDATETATCSACGDTTTRTVAGTAKGHNHISVTVKPTCTEVGYRNHLCRCGDEYRTDEVPALGHTPVTDAAVAATCITKGLTEGSHCEVCDAVITAQQETPTVGHTWGKGVITVEPTPDRGGTMMYTCIHCGVKDYFSVQYTEKVKFDDVSDDDYFADAVAWAAEKEITTGIGEGLFGPNEGCTRGQVVTFLWRAAGEPMPTVSENPFEDVSEGDFFYTAVLWAVEKGISTGVSAEKFDPASTCTRGQIVTFLWRSFGKEAAGIDNPFGDVSDGDYFYDAVLWAVDHGITTGVSAEKFAPDATCTRGQVVTFLYRAQ